MNSVLRRNLAYVDFNADFRNDIQLNRSLLKFSLSIFRRSGNSFLQNEISVLRKFPLLLYKVPRWISDQNRDQNKLAYFI